MPKQLPGRARRLFCSRVQRLLLLCRIVLLVTYCHALNIPNERDVYTSWSLLLDKSLHKVLHVVPRELECVGSLPGSLEYVGSLYHSRLVSTGMNCSLCNSLIEKPSYRRTSRVFEFGLSDAKVHPYTLDGAHSSVVLGPGETGNKSEARGQRS